MVITKDLSSIEDIQLLVDSFYAKVREDDKLKDIFNNVIKDQWPIHLEKMYRFWQTILLEEHTYFGSPFPPHAKLPVSRDHFDRWILLFETTVRENFSGENADKAVLQGQRMVEVFHAKIEYMKTNPNTLL